MLIGVILCVVSFIMMAGCIAAPYVEDLYDYISGSKVDPEV